MKVIRIKDQIEYFVVLAIKSGNSNIKELCSILSIFPKEAITKTLASMNNRALLLIHPSGTVEMNPIAVRAYEIIGNGVEVNDCRGNESSYELKNKIISKYASNDEELSTILFALNYKLVEV